MSISWPPITSGELTQQQIVRAAVLEHNARAWDRLAGTGQPLALPAPDRAFEDPHGWLGGTHWLPQNLSGLKVLCLAAGGGKHGPLYAAAGAHVTVIDLSPAMLELDRRVAQQRQIDLQLVCGSMDDLSMFSAAMFDLVIHPVSTCYLPEIQSVFREVARITRPDGLYVSQHKSPTSLQSSLTPGSNGRYEFQYPLSNQSLDQSSQSLNPIEKHSRIREHGTLEFVHSLSDLIGGICRAGFWIEDFLEPQHAVIDAAIGSFADRARFIPPYLRVCARRSSAKGNPRPGIFLS